MLRKVTHCAEKFGTLHEFAYHPHACWHTHAYIYNTMCVCVYVWMCILIVCHTFGFTMCYYMLLFFFCSSYLHQKFPSLITTTQGWSNVPPPSLGFIVTSSQYLQGGWSPWVLNPRPRAILRWVQGTGRNRRTSSRNLNAGAVWNSWLMINLFDLS